MEADVSALVPVDQVKGGQRAFGMGFKAGFLTQFARRRIQIAFAIFDTATGETP